MIAVASLWMWMHMTSVNYWAGAGVGSFHRLIFTQPESPRLVVSNEDWRFVDPPREWRPPTWMRCASGGGMTIICVGAVPRGTRAVIPMEQQP